MIEPSRQMHHLINHLLLLIFNFFMGGGLLIIKVKIFWNGFDATHTCIYSNLNRFLGSEKIRYNLNNSDVYAKTVNS